MKVTLGIVLSHGFPVPAPFVISYSGVLRVLLTGSGNALLPPDRRIDEARLLFGQDFPIDWARNRICKLFLDDDNGDYLLFLDADMTFPEDLVHRLVRHDVDVVTARYVMRKPPFFTIAMLRTGPGPTDYKAVEKVLPPEQVKGLVPIQGGGAGALLISRRALAGIRARLGRDDWFRYQDGEHGLRSRSEDMWFYEQALAAGFQPYLDADLQCGHVSQIEVDHRNHQPYRELFEQIEAERQAKLTEAQRAAEAPFAAQVNG